MIKPTRIAMFSGPRNISTAMMRSFENRTDTEVVDEPFYAAYLLNSGAQHPMREAILHAQPTGFDEVLAQLRAQPTNGAKYFFEKHIAFHFPTDQHWDWINEAKVFLLIRSPIEMAASYVKKYDDYSPIGDSFRIQKAILSHCLEHGMACPILSAEDILINPEGMLRELCGILSIPFSNRMLSWPAGPRRSDGVWAPHWYDRVVQSTGFSPYQRQKLCVSPAVRAIIDACHNEFEYLYERRLTLHS